MEPIQELIREWRQLLSDVEQPRFGGRQLPNIVGDLGQLERNMPSASTNRIREDAQTVVQEITTLNERFSGFTERARQLQERTQALLNERGR